MKISRYCRPDRSEWSTASAVHTGRPQPCGFSRGGEASESQLHSNCFRNPSNICFNSLTSRRNSATCSSNRATDSSSPVPVAAATVCVCETSISPPSKCAYRDSFVPGWRGSITASGGSRCISFCRLTWTASPGSWSRRIHKVTPLGRCALRRSALTWWETLPVCCPS